MTLTLDVNGLTIEPAGVPPHLQSAVEREVDMIRAIVALKEQGLYGIDMTKTTTPSEYEQRAPQEFNVAPQQNTGDLSHVWEPHEFSIGTVSVPADRVSALENMLTQLRDAGATISGTDVQAEEVSSDIVPTHGILGKHTAAVLASRGQENSSGISM